VFGVVLVTAAIIALVECFARFAFVGRGVPVPVAPTETLVVSGLYRSCRNPMYVCVVGAIVGQAFILGSSALLLYAGVVWVIFHLFVLVYEEPTLARQFHNYRDYKVHVPRWLPRLRPWP
jgi:protein-S-isoprenylcysteine O-methyltransferase Ste14